MSLPSRLAGRLRALFGSVWEPVIGVSLVFWLAPLFWAPAMEWLAGEGPMVEAAPLAFELVDPWVASEPAIAAVPGDVESPAGPTVVPALPAVPVVESAPAATEYEYVKTVFAKVTAYTPGPESCGASADGRTSIMKNAWRMNGVAADPRAVAYGSVVEIPGIGIKEVDDTGGAMRRSWDLGVYHFDVRFMRPADARAWGIRWVPVKIYRKKA